METEIELKFFVTPDFSDKLRRKIAATKILQNSCRELSNIYFDTQDNWLRQHDTGLRIRRFDDVYVQTVKTAGRVVAGLHQRPEYNAEHSCNSPDLSLHPHDIWPAGRTVEQVQQTLSAIFSTNFTREQWLVGMADGSQIEVAFDRGEVIAGEKSSPICEVELELKSGQADSLFTLARELSEDGGMRLGNLSKAARGYRLAQGHHSDKIRSLSLVDTTRQDSVESCFVHSLEHALSHWHYHEQIYFEHPSVDALAQVWHSISFIRQILTVFSSVIPRRASAILRQELKWLDEELSWLRTAYYIDDLCEDKGHALRKLDARKLLVKKLLDIKEQLPQQQEITALLSSARYTGLLLDLSRWLMGRGWHPFLDEKSKEKISDRIKPFSQHQLDRTWADLVEAFPPQRMLSRNEYIEQRYGLVRNLYTGVCFASLYDTELRNRFRMPWQDLLHGIDDLLTLQPLLNLVDDLEGDEKSQLQKWLARQEASILHAMEQTRAMSVEVQPYWSN